MILNSMMFTVTKSSCIDSRFHQPRQIDRRLLFDKPTQSEIIGEHVSIHQARNTILGMQQSFAVSIPFYTVLSSQLHSFSSNIIPIGDEPT